MTKNAIILLSGGLDSATCAGIAKEQGFSLYGLSFDYGQKHSVELNAAKALAKKQGFIQHHIVKIDSAQFKGSALVEPDIDIHDFNATSSIPNTYVPARNTLFLSYALAFAEVYCAESIFIGVSHVDYSGYPDCRPEFIKAFQRLANLATKRAIEGNLVTIETPLMNLSKAETIKKGIACGVDYSLTVSCYRADENGFACGSCDSCVYRRKGFLEAGIEDTTRYRL